MEGNWKATAVKQIEIYDALHKMLAVEKPRTIAQEVLDFWRGAGRVLLAVRGVVG